MCENYILYVEIITLNETEKHNLRKAEREVPAVRKICKALP